MTDATLTIPVSTLAGLRCAIDATLALCPGAVLDAMDHDGLTVTLPDFAGVTEHEPAPDAEERPQRPRAATAAADGAGSKAKRAAKPKATTAAKSARQPGTFGPVPFTSGVAARILEHLAARGPVEHPDGFASSVLADALDVNTGALKGPLLRLEKAGRIERHTNGKRTYRIDLPSQPARPTLAPVPDAAAVDVPGRGIVDQVRTDGLRDKLAARAEAAVE